jgi:tRNA(Ile)-lysidine synthetase-like protein
VSGDPKLSPAILAVPAGAWAVGVSGGADSVALLSLLRRRSDLSLHVVHLNHLTRGVESDEDARFVQALCDTWKLQCTVARLDEIEPQLKDPPANRSARFRAARLELFLRAVSQFNLRGVILAHHALDQAETILLRLLRGSGFAGLIGMSVETVVGGLTILRPLLHVTPDALRSHLNSIGQPWREDQSNQSPKYARNRARVVLQRSPALVDSLLALGEGCRDLHAWVASFPGPTGAFEVEALQRWPRLIARDIGRRWLIAQGASAGELDAHVLDRLIAMASDMSSPPRQHFPGKVLVRRRGGKIFAEIKDSSPGAS